MARKGASALGLVLEPPAVGWAAVPGTTKYVVEVNGKTVTSTKTALTAHGLPVKSGDDVQVVAQPSGTVQGATLTWAQDTVPNPIPPPPASGYGSVDLNHFAVTAWVNRGWKAAPVVHPNSKAMIDQLTSMVGGVWFNGIGGNGAWGSSEYRLDTFAGQPTKTFTLDVPHQGQYVVAVSWLNNFTPAPDGGDEHIIGGARDTGEYYELQGTNVSQGRAHSMATGNWKTGNAVNTADNRISILDISAGQIRPGHFDGTLAAIALRIAIPDSAAAFEWPAIASDGGGSGLIPSGACLWIDPALDLTKFGLDPYQLIVAKFWQQKGAWVGDSNGNSSSVTAYLEAVCDGSKYPFGSLSLPLALLQQAKILTAQSAGVAHAAIKRRPPHLADTVRLALAA